MDLRLNVQTWSELKSIEQALMHEEERVTKYMIQRTVFILTIHCQMEVTELFRLVWLHSWADVFVCNNMIYKEVSTNVSSCPKLSTSLKNNRIPINDSLTTT